MTSLPRPFAGFLKRLLIDTGPLLDLTIVELEEPTFRVAWHRLQCLNERLWEERERQRDRFVDYVRKRFGEVDVSIGSLLELDRRVCTKLKRKKDDLAAFEEFWNAYEGLCRRLEPSRVRTQPLAWDQIDRGTFLELGPVDAAVLQLFQENTERFFVTYDATLERRARTIAKCRVLDVSRIFSGDDG